MKRQEKISVSSAIVGAILVFIVSVWMLLYPPNFFSSQTIILFQGTLSVGGYNYLLYGFWFYYYSGFSMHSIEWLLVGCLGLITSIIVYALMLALISRKFLERINAIGILLWIAGYAVYFIFIFGTIFNLGTSSASIQQTTFLIFFLGVIGGFLISFGGRTIRIRQRYRKL